MIVVNNVIFKVKVMWMLRQFTWMLFWIANICECKVFELGVLFHSPSFAQVGSHSAGAISVALDHISKDNATFKLFHHQGHALSFNWYDDNCDQSIGLPLIADMTFGETRKVDSFIGPGCSHVCKPGGHLATARNIPMISWGCTSSVLSDKVLYPTFARTTAPNALSADFYVNILKYFNYNRVSIFYSSEHVWTLTAISLLQRFKASAIHVSAFSIFRPGFGRNSEVFEQLKTAMKTSKGMFQIPMHVVFNFVYVLQ